MLLGFFACIIPWGLYVLTDLPGFALQITNQLNSRSVGSGLALFLSQWAMPWPFVALVMLAGLAGLVRIGREARYARGLWLSQIILLLGVVIGCEGWYAVYVLPLTCIALVGMIPHVNAPRIWPTLMGVGSATLAGLLALSVVIPLARLSFLRGSVAGGHREYQAWCQEIERAIPAGSTVLLNCIPTPSFGLSPGRNALRLMRPVGYALKPAEQKSARDAIDYVVAGSDIDDPDLAEWVRTNHESRVRIGTGDNLVYVIRMR